MSHNQESFIQKDNLSSSTKPQPVDDDITIQDFSLTDGYIHSFQKVEADDFGTTHVAIIENRTREVCLRIFFVNSCMTLPFF